MSENVGSGGSAGASGKLADLTRAAASGRPPVAFRYDVPEEKAAAVTRTVEAAVRIAEAASHAAIEPSDGDPLMTAFMELGGTPWSQRPARPGRKSPRRHYRPVGLDREEAMRASAGAPKYPHVVLDGDDLDGNALAMVAAVMSAMREADIPDEKVDAVAGEALSKDYTHVLRTLTGLVTIRWRDDMHPKGGSRVGRSAR